jgi:class 3 adenylate cyclase
LSRNAEPDPVFHCREIRPAYCEAFSAATLFLDIPGFTAWTDALMQYQEDGAEVLTDALNRIMGPLVAAVYTHGGFISTFAGDAFTALFPLRTVRSRQRKNAVRHAAQVALYVQDFFNEQGSLQTRYGDFAPTARVGLSAGEVYWGILGETGRSAPASGLRTYFFPARRWSLRGRGLCREGTGGS